MVWAVFFASLGSPALTLRRDRDHAVELESHMDFTRRGGGCSCSEGQLVVLACFAFVVGFACLLVFLRACLLARCAYTAYFFLACLPVACFLASLLACFAASLLACLLAVFACLLPVSPLWGLFLTPIASHSKYARFAMTCTKLNIQMSELSIRILSQSDILQHFVANPMVHTKWCRHRPKS